MHLRPRSATRVRVLGRALVVSALGLSGSGLAGPVAGAGAQAAAPVGEVLCAGALAEPARLADAVRSGAGAALVREVNSLSRDELGHLADDDTAWVDGCDRVFMVEEAAPAGRQAAAQPTQTVPDAVSDAVPDDVFALASRPGADRTIHLDFDGATHSGTGWRGGETIVSPAYSVDGDRTTLTEAERAQVHLAWRVVAEDFAPFDVNVTTRAPEPSALTRSSRLDETYGMAVVVTPSNAVGAGCSCGGMAYVGVLGNPDANAYQPAWVFTDGSGTGGDDLGQAISHEVGHTFGLVHDGTADASYARGAKGWAPIMGSSYDRRASQWSSGEYAGADNTEDDVAVIASLAPVVADDHADTAAGASPVALGAPATGVLASRTDLDAFAFSASGPTTLAVSGPPGLGNLDVRLTVLDAGGGTVAVVDPVADTAVDDSLAAVWTADLPSEPATFTAVVDGTGHGDPREPGRYSDYGSLGAYTVTLARTEDPVPPVVGMPTDPDTPTSPTNPTGTTGTADPTGTTGQTAPAAQPAPPPAFVTTRLPAARVGRTYRAEIRFTGAISEARVDRRLPLGLRWRVLPGRIVITGRLRTREASRFAAVLSGDDSSVRRQFRLRVR